MTARAKFGLRTERSQEVEVFPLKSRFWITARSEPALTSPEVCPLSPVSV